MRQKLTVNLAVFVILVAGIYSLSGLNRESIPQISLDMVSVVTVFPGAAPNDAEELISIPIEKKLRGVSGIDKVRSYNVENVSFVVIYLDDRAKDKKKIVQDIKDAVEQVEGLPASVQKPLVTEINFDNTELVSVAFVGKTKDVPYARLREFANLSENFFYDIDGIAEVEKLGYYDREYLVEVDPDVLTKYRIGMNTLINTLRMRNVDFPGGALRVGKKEFVLRTKGQFKNADEIRNTIIMANDGGYVTRIGDIAKVSDTYEEADVHHRFNGKQAVVFKLWKKRSADEIDLSNRLRAAVAGYSLPGYNDVALSFFDDKSDETRHRLAAVGEEAALGFLILGLFILLLLGRRMSLIVLSGIPTTFMLVAVVMSYLGMTFNIVSLFGMIMVLGMVVDFSVVIAENSHRFMEIGEPRASAIERGVAEIFWPVTVTLICIITAFMPLLLVTGMIGKFIKPIPTVIITALIASWVVAMFVLPVHLNMFLEESHKNGNGEQSMPMRFLIFVFSLFKKGGKTAKSINRSSKSLRKEDPNFETGGFGQVQRKYKSVVSAALRYRYLTVGVLMLLLIVSVGLLGRMGFKFIPAGGEELIRVKIKLPQELNLEANLEEMKKVEKIVSDLPRTELKVVHARVGEEHVEITDPKPATATFKTTFDLHLTPEKERDRIAKVIGAELRDKLARAQADGVIPRDMEVKVEPYMKGPPVGKPVNVEIRGGDFAVMKEIADEYMSYLSGVKGIRNLSIDLEEGKTEYRYTVRERIATRAGVSTYDIASAINASFAGAVATKVNQREEEVGIRVRFDEEARTKMKGPGEVRIANMAGGLVPLDAVSEVRTGKAYSQINRLNYKRLVQVQADVDIASITPVEVTKLLEKKFADIEARYPGYSIAYGGEQEDTNESMGELGTLFIMALLVIYVVLAVFMHSLVIPFVVMIAIPFALIGVVFALFTHGLPLSFMSVLGLLSLAGIIVSNTLVLVQFIGKFRDEGLSLKDAIVEGGVVRLRPIILTAGAMVLELIPVIYGFGGKDYLVTPLALAFGYGLLFATFITLVLVPCFYHIVEDTQGVIRSMLSRFGITGVQPALPGGKKPV